jgi:hypothetical protein
MEHYKTMKDVILWVFAAMLLLVACGATANNTPPVAAQENDAPIRYYAIDAITTTFMPDPTLPVVCFYVESQKIPEHSAGNIVLDESASWVPAVYTSGLSCLVLPDLDNYLERYPQ